MTTSRTLSVKLESRAADRTLSGVLGDLASLTFTERWMDVGGWVAVMPTASNAAALLTVAGAGIVVTDDLGRPLFSGPANLTADGTQTAVERTRSEQDGVESDITTVAGIDDWGTLRERLAHPEPVALDTGAAEYDVRTGPATTVLLEYIDANAGPSAVAARRIAGLVLNTDPATGSTITGRARFQQLHALLRELAIIGGATVDVRQVGDNLEVTAYATIDRTASVVFAPELGNTVRVKSLATSTDATDVLIAGQGDGTARTTAWRTAVTPFPARRLERFIDRRDLATLAELEAAGDAYLLENGGVISVEVDPIDTATFQYGRDYRLGDLVGIAVGAAILPTRLTACTTTIKAGTLTRTLTIGVEPTRGTAALLRSISNVGSRVSTLERV